MLLDQVVRSDLLREDGDRVSFQEQKREKGEMGETYNSSASSNDALHDGYFGIHSFRNVDFSSFEHLALLRSG